MKYDFDRLHDRRGTASYKWDQLTTLFGGEDVLPLWVADMDFVTAKPIVDAMTERAQAGIYGYTIRTDEWIEAIQGWYRRRHNWDIAKESIVASPSVVTSLSLAVDLFSEPGAGVILQAPVYYPFYDVIRSNGRQVLKNALKISEATGLYEMDFESLEEHMRSGAKLLLLCNPHNPGGRVWTREELTKLAALAAQYDVTVVSDEIHGDLVFAPNAYTPYATVGEEAAATSLSLLAPTKTFNLPGIGSSFIVTNDPAKRAKLNTQMKKLSIHMQNHFAHFATIAAYNEGDEWLDQLLPYIKGNVDYAIAALRERAPMLKVMPPEGTYLLWVDARELGLNAKGMSQFMNAEAKVAFNEGSSYGDEGVGYVRINCACPRSILEEALRRFVGAVERKVAVK
ncbi:pyridoxal phosphate-dependent aminotransferase [Paenibacillus antri]|uniref:cysteine-S-conjugate beta-lyase n=1 Tax=Paenibacillus antri TaxID=2582848 RepID=A0A5R9G4W1_9BACL|nr:MalY/PatB family protein [Paenibacillus antri]TLS49180.1 pyridoxal phosphate-dependent aminotransferase [Paenibacillus antri]